MLSLLHCFISLFQWKKRERARHGKGEGKKSLPRDGLLQARIS